MLDAILALLAVLAALAIWHRTRRTSRPTPPRKPGEWTPVPFRYPAFDAWHDFDLHTTKPVAYRPFRWGTYPVHMGIRAMQWDSWIELDNQYLAQLAIRKARVASRRDKVVRTLPGAEAAAREACTELASYLAKRYPHIFHITRATGLGDSIAGPHAGRVKTVEIVPTGDKWDLDTADPMEVAGLLADDLAVMVEGPDGRYYMRAGSVCVPGSWRLEDKIGLPLAEIHLRGNVYKYKENLEFSMDRFFRKLTPDKAVVRNNYFFQLTPDLAWLHTHHGPEETFDQGTKKPRAEADTAWTPLAPISDVSQIFFRSERQTLRRLPRTGCILFTIRTYLHSVTELVREPGVPGRLAAAIRGWDDAVARRKDRDLYADTMLPWLDELHEAQVDAGIVKAEDQTSHYPF